MAVSPSQTVCIKVWKRRFNIFFKSVVVAQWVCSMYFRWLGILLIQNKDLKTHFKNFHSGHMTALQNLVWKGMWATVVKGIWKQKNLLPDKIISRLN